MKKLHFHSEMHLTFSSPVWDHHYRFRCIPMEDGIQKTVRADYQILPGGCRNLVFDGLGSQAFCGSIQEPHCFLTLITDGDVEIDLNRRKREELHPIYRYPSACTQPDEGLKELAGRLLAEYKALGFNSGKKDWAMVQFFMDQLSRLFFYVPGVTTIRTTAAQALQGGRGVCQDYAHILIALCRLAGIPARYVAGMMAGEGASHAWTEVYLDGMWIGADPTHARMTDESYIKLSHGRDYEDCTIDKGCFKGSASQTQQIQVKVEEIS